MGISLTTFTDGTTVSASAIRDIIQTIEDYVNTGITQSDLGSPGAWVDYSHVYKPDFYGSPSPRTEFQSGDVYYRFAAEGRDNYAIFHADPAVDVWLPVQGLCATVRHPPGASSDFLVMASFWAFTVAGSTGGPVTDSFMQRSARFALFLNDIQIPGTTREIYAIPTDIATASPGPDTLFGRANISLVGKTFLTSPTVNVGVKIKLDAVTDTGGEPDWKHTFVAARSFVVDTQHLAA